MRASELEQPSLASLEPLLVKLHRGKAATLDAKKTQALFDVLGDGWSMNKMVFIKPSDESQQFDKKINIYDEGVSSDGRPWRHHVSLLARSDRETLQLTVRSFDQNIAEQQHDAVAKYLVTELPDPKSAKSDDFFVMNLTTPVRQAGKIAGSSDRDHDYWVWSFMLYRRCTGYRVTVPNGKHFDVCGPDRVLGFGGVRKFEDFFKWAVQETDIQQRIADLLGQPLHVQAKDRPRVPVGGQTIGTCAICRRAQVVRNGMVNHGYERPGYGYIVGDCFGVHRDPYEVSPNACKAYIPVLQTSLEQYTRVLQALQSGTVTVLQHKKRDRATGKTITVDVNKGEPLFQPLLDQKIDAAQHNISGIKAHIAFMEKSIADWKPGTLRRNEG